MFRECAVLLWMRRSRQNASGRCSNSTVRRARHQNGSPSAWRYATQHPHGNLPPVWNEDALEFAHLGSVNLVQLRFTYERRRTRTRSHQGGLAILYPEILNASSLGGGDEQKSVFSIEFVEVLVHEAGFQGAPERQVAFVPALLETEGENRPHPSLLGRRDQVLLSSNSLSRLFALPLTTAILRASPASAVALRAAAAQACGFTPPALEMSFTP